MLGDGGRGLGSNFLRHVAVCLKDFRKYNRKNVIYKCFGATGQTDRFAAAVIYALMLRRHEVVAVEPDQPFFVTGTGFKNEKARLGSRLSNRLSVQGKRRPRGEPRAEMPNFWRA